MKRKQRLNTKLLAVFFLGVFVLAMAEFLVFSYLLRSIEQEEQIINEERLTNAQLRLDVAFAQIDKLFAWMIEEPVFSGWERGNPKPYDLYQMHMKASEVFSEQKQIDGWVIYLQGTDSVISNGGTNTRQQYNKQYSSPAYPLEYWEALLQTPFGVGYFAEAEFTYLGQQAQTVTQKLMPVALNPYYKERYMAVLFLDMREICRDSDTYLQEGIYLFDGEKCLYTSDADPVITSMPQDKQLTAGNKERYAVHSTALANGLTLVKLQPEQEAAAFLRSSFAKCILVAVGALVVAVALVLTSVRRMMDPVNRMLGLIHQHAEAKTPGFRFDACQELEVILKNREQQAAALAQRDAVLSEYFLQSRLKNVYVDMYSEEAQDEGTAYILYIQVQYQQACQERIAMPRAELESCIQGMLSSTLSNLFESTMVFQLEPGRFAARVALPREDGGIRDRMERFMERLAFEQEFACFTVIQSQALEKTDALSEVYTQVQEAARMARVCDRSQLLTLPLPEGEDKPFIFTQQQEKKLLALVSEQRREEATELAGEILDENLNQGISHMQMEILCVAIVNTVAQAANKLGMGADKIAAASGVYNMITTKCGTAAEYCRAVTNFICSMGADSTQIQETDPLLEKVRSYLEENYQREFSGEDMAAALHVSRSYLSTYYKSKTGINLNESIQIYRIQKAVELLQSPEVRIAEVGPMVGIPSSNTFLRWFKKYTGMTPNEYRNKAREE